MKATLVSKLVLLMIAYLALRFFQWALGRRAIVVLLICLAALGTMRACVCCGQ